MRLATMAVKTSANASSDGIRMRHACRPLVAVALLAPLAVAQAHATTLHVDYGLSLLGLPVGTAEMSGEFGKDRYALNAKGRLTGLLAVVASGKGVAAVSGTISGGKLVPAEFTAFGGTSALNRAFRIAFANGNATQVAIAPPYIEKADKVPVLEPHKLGVLDPLTAMVGLSKGKAGPLDPTNCDRTLPIYEGSQRFDVTLRFAERRAVKIEGYAGDVLVCTARYIPISGHRAMRPTVKFMQDNKDISVWLAPVAGGPLLAPLRVSVRTTVGTAIFQAEKWHSDGVLPASR
jgi:hypothetical protein